MIGHKLTENLVRDAQGFVYYKGRHVEHYSFTDEARELAAANELEAHCQHLEAIGAPVNSNSAIWYAEQFAGVQTKNDPIIDLIALEIYEKTDATEIVIEMADKWHRFHNGYLGELDVKPDELHNWYHPMQKLGYGIAKCGQEPHLGDCYATLDGLREMYSRHGITSIRDIQPIYRHACGQASWQKFIEAMRSGRKVEIDSEMFDYWLGVLPPVVQKGFIDFFPGLEGKKALIAFGFAEGYEKIVLFWDDPPAKRYFCQQSQKMNKP